MNKIRKYALTAFMILVPLCYWPNLSRASQEAFFQYAAICVIASFIGNIWIGSFLLLNVASFIYNGGQVGWDQVVNTTFGCMIFAFCRYYFKSNKFEDVVKTPVLIVAAVTMLFMAFQLFHLDPLFSPQSNNPTVFLQGPLGDPVGFFGIKEANGTFLTIAMPIMASINPILGLLILLPIKLSQSSSVYLAALIVILFYTWNLYRQVFKWLCVLIPIVGFFVISDLHTDPKTFTSRFPIWHSAIKYALKPPSFGLGYGPDSYRNLNNHKNFIFTGDEHYNHAVTSFDGDKEIFMYYSPTSDTAKLKELSDNIQNTKVVKGQMDRWDNPHNAYINLLFQFGILGVVLLGFLMKEMWNRFRFASKDKELIVITSCLLVYFVTGLTNFPLELARTGFLFPILLGAFYSKTDEI